MDPEQKGYGATLTSFWETTEICLGLHLKPE
jgi:hypothetical protein